MSGCIVDQPWCDNLDKKHKNLTYVKYGIESYLIGESGSIWLHLQHDNINNDYIIQMIKSTKW